jgi:hypothetical protein
MVSLAQATIRKILIGGPRAEREPTTAAPRPGYGWSMKLVFTLVFLIGCGGSSSKPAPGPGPAPVAMLTPEQCTRQGGEVRGDIGDGKIACAQGERELGRVPLGIEGSICCAPAVY